MSWVSPAQGVSMRGQFLRLGLVYGATLFNSEAFDTSVSE